MPTILTKSTIYLGENLFGKASKITAPDIDHETLEIKNALGTYNVNTAIKAMTTSVTLNGFYKSVFDKIANPLSEINMTIYGSLDTFNNETLTKSEQAKLIIRGSSQKFSLLGELEQQNNIDYSIDFNCSSARLFVGNIEKYYIDIPNMIWKIGGVDILAKIKKNLALL